MDFKLLSCIVIVFLSIGLFSIVKADDDYYDILAVCDNRCEIKRRLNPFAEGCDDCCRQRGYQKGKCKGFGWAYCMCKPFSQLRQLFNSIVNNQLQG